jgi:HAD superfamily hydrolase (TIGR01490 family)
MADPIIMAFARGILREFPGDPNSIVDIVPVDHVVNATLAAVAKNVVERPAEPRVYQVASGARNPLRYRDLYDIVRGYFLEHPLRDSGGRPVPVPEWSFPGRRKVEGLLRAELLGLKAANAITVRMPEGHAKTELRGRVARAEKRSRMSLYFSRIYGAYANMRSNFAADHTHALHGGLAPEDREEFPFDISEVDWTAYLAETHLPALTQKPGRKKRRARKEEQPGQVAAIFDVDGTLVASNVVAYYAWLKLHDLPRAQRPLFALKMLGYAPFYWALDKVSRTQFNRVFYRNYKGWKPARAAQLGRQSFAGYTVGRLFPEAVETLREHKRAGHRVVILSGALDFLLEPFREVADDVLSASLETEDGVYTGELSGAPVAGEARARMLASFARKRGVDLARSYAYADAISDLPMLEAVGNPVAVNPDRRLLKAAKERGWQIRDWRRDGARNGAPPRGKSG